MTQLDLLSQEGQEGRRAALASFGHLGGAGGEPLSLPALVLEI